MGKPDTLFMNNGFEKDSMPAPFGTWVWDSREISRPGSVLQFLTANGVNEIYLVFDPRVKMDTYRRFVAAAGAAGSRVALIGADAEWILPRGQEGRDRYFSFYKKYQAAALPDEKFYGMHMDIEPHQLPEWQSGNPDAVRAFCDFMRKAREIAGMTSSLLEMDIPCWFDRFPCEDAGETTNLIEFCVRLADTTLFMSYRDNARAAVEFAQAGIAAGEKHGKKISLAFETGHIYEDVNITFDHLGTVPLRRELKELRRILGEEHPMLEVGLAVHHYNSWVALPSNGNPKGPDFPYGNPSYDHLLE